MFCNINFTQSFPETLQITLILQENKQYGETTQKPKIGQKRLKLLKVSFSRSSKGKHCHDQAAKTNSSS